jgi:ferredoxin--NADP+ reductase
VLGLLFVKNELVAGADCSIKAKATQTFEDVETGLVFRSVGYRGVALPGVPFDEKKGTISNDAGRVLDAAKQPVVGAYTAGWIKRGPSGVIGTNRACAVETVKGLAADLAAGKLLAPSAPSRDAVTAILERRGVKWFTFADWSKLDAVELAKGAASGRPRVKFTSPDEMRAAVSS